MAFETAEMMGYDMRDLEGWYKAASDEDLQIPSSVVFGSALESRYLTTGFAGLAAITLGSFL